MPIKSTYTLKCKKCGKEFKVTVNDAIMPKDQKMLENPICRFCKFKKALFLTK